MVTFNAFIYLTVMCCLNACLGEMLQKLTASIQVTGVIDQTTRDNKSREFADILDYFIKLTSDEEDLRSEVAKLVTVNLTEDGDGEKLYGFHDWHDAINETLHEENLAEFNVTLEQSVVKHIEDFLSNPDPMDHKERYDQMRLNTRRSAYDDHDTTNSSAESPEDNEFWDDVAETRRIFGGNKTKIKHFPFMASVQIFERFSCGGSIIKSDLVITAASCLQLAWNNRFFRENPAFLSVRVGTHFFAVGGELVPVTEVYFHPSYIPRTLVNNLAVMRLERHLRFRKRYVKKIDFDRSDSSLPYNTPGITIVGWGAKTHANKIYNALVNMIHMTILDVYELESCREIYGKKFVTKTNFCAGFISSGQGACNLDVGDPGVSGRLLMGVVSFGSPICGRVDTPTVFTKLGYYADWIESIMELDVAVGKARTTSAKPFTLDKIIRLFDEESDNDPIPPLREGLGEKAEIPEPEESGIQPILKGEPKYVEFKTTNYMLRTNESEDEEEKKVTIQIAQSKDDIEKEKSTQKEGDSDGDSMNAKPMITKVIDLDPKDSMSGEIEAPLTENVVEISTTVDYTIKDDSHYNTKDDSQADTFDGAILPVNSDGDEREVTDMGNVEPEKDREKEVLKEIHRKPATLTDEDDKSHTNIKMPRLSKKKHRNIKRKKKDKEETTDHITTPVSEDENKSEIPSPASREFGAVEEKHKDTSENNYNASQPDYFEMDNKYQPRGKTEEQLIEREIEKLLKQLEFSDEQGTLSNDPNVTNAMKNNDNDEKKNDDVLTLLYISDNEKEIKLRASDSSESDEHALNIDPEPFIKHQTHQNTTGNKTKYKIGQSDIYEIFQKVIKAVVNKTSHH